METGIARYHKSIQSVRNNILRPYFLKPLANFGALSNKLGHVITRLYGLLEAGVHWFRTYYRFQFECLRMNLADHDLCLLFFLRLLESSSSSRGMTVLQTDDTLTITNTLFLQNDEKAYERFLSKPLHVTQHKIPFFFNSLQITVRASSISLNEVSQIKRL